MTTTAPQRQQVEEAVVEMVRRRPGITVNEIVDELAFDVSPEVILGLLGNLRVTGAVVARPEDALEDAWGPAPSDVELDAIRRAGEHAEQATLAVALDGALSRDEAAERIGLTPQAVSERRKAGKLVGLRRGREWRFPAWQFADDGTLPALAELIGSWPGSSLALSTWAVTPSVDLEGLTPAQALRRRDTRERVLELTHALTVTAW
jgi:hypothetical protein